MKTTKYYFTALLFAGVVCIGSGGCAGKRPNDQPAIPKTAINERVDVEADQLQIVRNDGSLWQTSSSLNSLFMDTKARKVGDIVTIRIDESSRATNKANVSLFKVLR